MPFTEKKNGKYTRWNDNAISEILKLLQTQSLSRAAKLLGISPQSISKALMRRGISVRGYLRLTARKSRKTQKPRGFIKPLDASASENAIRAFAYLAPCGCRFPLGELDSNNFRFCNARRHRGSYCKKHAKIVFEVAA